MLGKYRPVWVCFFAMGWLLMHPSIRAGDDQVELIGPLGDDAHLKFAGDLHFTEAQLRFAMRGDLQLQLAASPIAPMRSYLQLLQKRLADGYKRNGYVDPQVKADIDAGKTAITVTIAPGQRFKCGAVQINNPGPIDPAELVRWLTQPLAPVPFATTCEKDVYGVISEPGQDGQPAIWSSGYDAPFDGYESDSIKSSLRWKFAQLGYLHPVFRAWVEPDEAAAGKAKLSIDMLDAGPRAVIHHVEFQTLTRNTEASVCRFLGIHPGDPIDEAKILQMQEKLFNSGRFLRDKITMQYIPGVDREIVLKFEIDEAPNLPPLDQPLTAEQQTLLKFRDWCAVQGDDGRDICIELKAAAGNLKVALGGNRGWAVRGRLTGQNDFLGPLMQDHSDIGVALTDELSVYLPSLGRKTTAVLNDPFLQTCIKLAPKPQMGEIDHPWQWNIYGSTIGKSDVINENPPRFYRWLAPVMFMDQFGQNSAGNDSIDHGILTLRPGWGELRIDCSTGSIVDGKINDGIHKLTGTIEIRAHGFESLKKELDDSCPVAIADGHGIINFFRFGIDACLELNALNHGGDPQKIAAASAVARKLFDTDVMKSMSDLIKNCFSFDSEDDFYIPGSFLQGNAASPWSLFYYLAFRLSSEMYPTRTWPATLMRDEVLLNLNHLEVAAPEVKQVLDNQNVGPIGAWLIAEFCRSWNPQFCQALAKAVLERQSGAGVVSDIATLFPPDAPQTRIALQLATNLRSLSAEEIDALAESLPAPGGKMLHDATDTLQHRLLPLDSSDLTQTAEAVWWAGGKDILNARLHRLAESQPP